MRVLQGRRVACIYSLQISKRSLEKQRNITILIEESDNCVNKN